MRKENKKPYDMLVFIGRFQPFHAGHQIVVEKARKMADRVLLVVGSSYRARSVRNPFKFEERKQMIQNIYPDVLVEPIRDYTYNDTEWVVEMQKIVHEQALKAFNPSWPQFNAMGVNDMRIGLIGCNKDHSSYYLKLFPQWSSESVEFLSPINATAIRDVFFNEEQDFRRWEMDILMDDSVFKFMENFQTEPAFRRLMEEWQDLKSYKRVWGDGPFLTADSLVQVGGHILLIKRGNEFGKGLYALPGGFVAKNEKFLDAALRELKEETRLKVPLPVLKGSIINYEMFDDPHRSERARLVTSCYHIKLENELNLPEVRGSDDAEWAGFVDISTLKEDMFFEDHYYIIRKMLGI